MADPHSVADPESLWLTHRLASLLQDALDVRNYGQHMYFSYRTDITRSFQNKLKLKQQQQQHGDQVSSLPESSERAIKGALGPLGQRNVSVLDGCDEAAGLNYVDKGYVFNRGLLEPFRGVRILRELFGD